MSGQDFQTVFERSNGTETVTYSEGIEFYRQLALNYPYVEMKTMGQTDSGEPLHLVLLNTDEKFSFQELKESNKTIFLINNAIHAGESDGVDASMLLIRNLTQNAAQYDLLDSVILAVIPFYNVGGVLNRNGTTRVNQNGPDSYGFRANAQNYDLNRDFIKMDSKNAYAFAEIFHQLQPDLFVDTHVTNGTDHQHVVTVLSTQKDKLGGPLGTLLENKIEPAIFSKMQVKGYDAVVYVNVHGKTPDEGWTQFWDAARYSTGYAALFQTIGMMTENHMLKPYKIRVEAIYDFLLGMSEIAARYGAEIKLKREVARANLLKTDSLAIQWEHDREEFKMISLKGYATSYPESELTGNPILQYDQENPYEKEVPFFNHYKVKRKVGVPEFYIIPQSWQQVIARLKANGVVLTALEKDTTINVEAYRITDFQTVNRPYEGHYLHYNTTVQQNQLLFTFRKGDFLINTRQLAKQYIVETLEPEAQDSFFNWNFFDSILQQKEGFSDYVFEPKARQIFESFSLEEKAVFDSLKKSDSIFSDSNNMQLDWIFKRSAHYEAAHMQYPVYRLFKE